MAAACDLRSLLRYGTLLVMFRRERNSLSTQSIENPAGPTPLGRHFGFTFSTNSIQMLEEAKQEEAKEGKRGEER